MHRSGQGQALAGNTEAHKSANTEKPRVRARGEHVFGHIANSMNGCYVRTIGLAKLLVETEWLQLRRPSQGRLPIARATPAARLKDATALLATRTWAARGGSENVQRESR
jgi:hypothetical protein